MQPITALTSQNYLEGILDENVKSTPSQADTFQTIPKTQAESSINVELTDEAKALAEEYNAAQFAKQMTGTTADGGSVTVQRTGATPSTETGQQSYTYSATIQGTDGQSFSFDFNENVRLNKGEDNTYSAYFAASNKTRTYNTDGSFSEVDGDLYANSDADAVHIGVNNDAIKTGNGNNLVFVYGDNVSVAGGSGDDTVHVANNVSGTTIDTGEGNDTVIGTNAYNTTIQLGSGNNSVSMQNMHGGSITAGDGNNKIESAKLDGISVSLGHGDNSVKASYLYNKAHINAGDGNNHVDIYSVGMTATRRDSASGGNVTLGNGNNSVDIYQSTIGSNLELGHGDNTVNVSSLSGKASIGSGNNDINISSLGSSSLGVTTWSGHLTVGDGNNKVNINNFVSMSTLRIGNGDNDLQVYSLAQGQIHAGNGNNAITVYDMLGAGAVYTGNGNNKLSIHTMNGGKASFGNGNNNLSAYQVNRGANISFGDGNNSVSGYKVDYGNFAFGNGKNSFAMEKVELGNLTFGEGNNTIAAKSFSGTVTTGDGDNSIFVETLRSIKTNFGAGNNMVLAEILEMPELNKEHMKGNMALNILSSADSEFERQAMITDFENRVGMTLGDFKAGYEKSFDVSFIEKTVSDVQRNQTALVY